MLEPVHDQEGNVIARRFTRPDGSQMLVPPDQGLPMPAPFNSEELQAVLSDCARLKDEVSQSSSSLKEPVLFLASTLERLIVEKLNLEENP